MAYLQPVTTSLDYFLMITLPISLKHWHSDSFIHAFRNEVLALAPGSVPLQQVCTQGGHVDNDNIDLMVLSHHEDDINLQIKAGFFFIEIIGGCNCHDDPIDSSNYCEFLIIINKSTAECSFTAHSE